MEQADRDLVERVLKRDAFAFRELYNRYSEAIFSHLSRLVRDKAAGGGPGAGGVPAGMEPCGAVERSGPFSSLVVPHRKQPGLQPPSLGSAAQGATP